MRSAAVGFQCPSCVKEGHATVRRPRGAYGGQAHDQPLVTYVLVGLCGLLLLLTGSFAYGFGASLSSLFQHLALQPCGRIYADGTCVPGSGGVADGEYYRLLTSTFLHFGLIHFALNMYVLWLVGPSLERTLGRARFTLVYLLSGLGGAALSYALGPVQELAAGASGAVFGLFGAFLVIQHRRGGELGGIGATIMLNLVLSFALPNIDWRGHVGGLVTGALVTAALVYAPPGRQRPVVQGLGLAAVALLVVGLVAARTAALT